MAKTSPPTGEQAAHPKGHRQTELRAYAEEESKLSAEELDAREDRWAYANAREAVHEERW